MRDSRNEKMSESGHLVIVCLVMSLLLAIGVPWDVVKLSAVEPLPKSELALVIESNQHSDGMLQVDIPAEFADVELPLLDPVTHFPIKHLYGLKLRVVDSVNLENGSAFTSSKYKKQCFVLWDNGFFTRHLQECGSGELLKREEFLTLYRFSADLSQHPEVLASISAREWREVADVKGQELHVNLDPALGLKTLYPRLYLAFYQKAELFSKARYSGGIRLDLS